MSEEVLVEQKSELEERFPDISRDERKGYAGFIVPAEKLVEFATGLRDEFGYDFLSSVTGVDYLPENQMEVVYQAYEPAVDATRPLVRLPEHERTILGIWLVFDLKAIPTLHEC